MAALGDKDVGRLDVPVHDALGVGGIERVCYLDGQRKQRLQVQRSNPDHVLQRLAVQKLHRDESFAVLVVNFVDGTDIRMIQGRSSLRLSLEAG